MMMRRQRLEMPCSSQEASRRASKREETSDIYGGGMRKDIIGDLPTARQSHDDADWLDVERIARVQLTSEDPAFPIENAPEPES
jgi:hypothetical protein